MLLLLSLACLSRVQFSLLSELDPSTKSGQFLIQQPLMEHELKEFKLLGTCISDQSNASILLPNAQVSVIQKDSLIGKNFGRVTDITPTSVEIKERFFDSAGNENEQASALNLLDTPDNNQKEPNPVLKISSSSWNSLIDTTLRQNGQLELNKKISLELHKVTIAELLRSLEVSTGGTFYLDGPLPKFRASVSFTQVEAKVVVEQILLMLLNAELVPENRASLIGGFYLRKNPRKAQKILSSFKKEDAATSSDKKVQLNYPIASTHLVPKMLRCINQNSGIITSGSNTTPNMSISNTESSQKDMIGKINSTLKENNYGLFEHKGMLIVLGTENLDL
ncbi:MAG: hypothetical protein CMK59_08895 [Proteobacteria bacterium]|nr:hypothetical protein [Pseudomonadota bacterium]